MMIPIDTVRTQELRQEDTEAASYYAADIYDADVFLTLVQFGLKGRWFAARISGEYVHYETSPVDMDTVKSKGLPKEVHHVVQLRS